MKNKIIDLDTLTEYLNKSQFNSTNDEIAMYLYEHRNEIADKSLNQLAVNSYISQPSFTRFFKKYGVSKYQDFKHGIIESNVNMKYYINYLKSSLDNQSISDLKQSIIDKQIQSSDIFLQLDENKLLDMINVLNQYKKVVFIGSDLSMSLLRSFQVAMIYKGVNCYTLADSTGQENMIKLCKENDLVICVSIKGRWLTSESSKTTMNVIKESSCYKMLWTLDNNFNKYDDFDYIYYFGKSVNEFGYTQLTNFIFLLTQLYLK